MTIDHTYTLEEVLALDFEARCVGPDGARYLWHKGLGLRVERESGETTLIWDPARLPAAGWSPTRLGLEELAAGEDDESAPAGAERPGDRDGSGDRLPPEPRDAR